ncbi:hypothetical protein [Kitasatospora cineracea]|uniref:Prepilin-type processing-associated H-X9-DG protein n=1 Tax=Kitasatospora cineracea TaxID=88074 RepID=A0A3N4RLW5_9ACTN|nr:hypothetical protein [Kitasatospora cineracea]RPE27950.1 prepilin-type processing-associated H-X9-DG protein [Kitasatospora cineracea]
MEMIGSTGLHREPWPERMSDGRPALILPQTPDRQVLVADGWVGLKTIRHCADAATEAHPGWSAVLDDYRLTLHRPDGTLWFDGHVAADRHWRRRLRDHHTLLLITGPFTTPFDFRPAAQAGHLLLLTTPARLLGGP